MKDEAGDCEATGRSIPTIQPAPLYHEESPMPIETVLLREATVDDIPFLRAMIWEAILASPTLLNQLGVAAVQQHEERYWSDWPQHPDPAFVALDSNGHLLGALLLQPNETGGSVQSWRIGMGVVAEARGQGVGRHLIERALEFARTGGAADVNLFVDPANTRAMALYQHTGFVAAGTRDALIEMRFNLK